MILGHTRQIEYLEQAIARGRMAHAYFFYGPERVGKVAAAKETAKALFCLHAGGKISAVCGECSECRKIDENIHTHVIFLDTEHTLVSKKETRKDMPIDDIRELKRICGFAPEGGKWRVVIVNQAEKMSREAANAFLKLLEEPGPQTLIILVNSTQELILPTILSRTQRLYFPLVSDGVLRVFLEKKGVSSAKQEDFLRIARGRPGVLFSLLEDAPAVREEEELLKRAEEIFSKKDVPAAFRLNEKIASDARFRVQYTEYILHRLRKNLLERAGGEEAKRLIGRIKRIDRVSTLLETTNANPRLALDIMALEAFGESNCDAPE